MDDACDGPDDAVAQDDCPDGRERADAILTIRGPVWISSDEEFLSLPP